MKVLKFGGTSVASAKNIIRVKEIVTAAAGTSPVLVVVSAFGGVTNLLEEVVHTATADRAKAEDLLQTVAERHLEVVATLFPVDKRAGITTHIEATLTDLAELIKGVGIIGELTPKLKDKAMSVGERLSAAIISRYLALGRPVKLLDPQQIIITDDSFGQAAVDYKATYANMAGMLPAREQVLVCPGFIGGTADGRLTTLGRGGSDFTAALFARGLMAAELQIWTDVSGMMTADPRVVKTARVIEKLSYEEAMELSHFGAKVIYPPTIQPVMEKGIPLRIKNTLQPQDAGTLITVDDGNGGKTVQGLSSITHLALVNLKGPGMVGVPSLSYRLFRCFAKRQINIILITQASSEHTISVVIKAEDAPLAAQEVAREFEQEVALGKIDPLEIEYDLAIVALVGSKMQNQVGVSGKMFAALGANGVNIKAIAQGSSERNISTVIAVNDLKKALNSLHERFFLSARKRINLFVVGTGNVGGAFLRQIEQQAPYLLANNHLDLRVVGLANSRRMLFAEEGIDLPDWQQQLASAEPLEAQAFVQRMAGLNLRNSIFIDNTATESIPALYLDVLQHSISVVTPNKVAAAAAYPQYLALKSTALRYRAQFLIETNVGAGLPVISTLNDLIKSGDKVTAIEAVLSGSLNFIFNQYTGRKPFAEIVRQAQAEGYTEPDPRLDLSGLDVRRKLLILMREAGVECELPDIKGEQFVPEACFAAPDVDGFYALLAENEPLFREMLDTGTTEGRQLKYVARFKGGQAGTGLVSVAAGHPFYNLQGKDNIVLFYTDRYAGQPLLIKGAGAGAEVTASGIFADVMKVANS